MILFLTFKTLWCLRSIVLAFSNRPDINIKSMIEESLESTTSFIIKHSLNGEVFYNVDYKVLLTSSMTLAAFC